MKKMPLNQLEAQLAETLAPPAPEAETQPAPRRKRSESVLLPFAVNPAARKQLKIMAAELGRTQQDLTIEALNMLFKHYGKKQIA
jgi:hypothetical protein